MAVEIHIAGGLIAYVDDCDAHLAEQKWCAHRSRKNKTAYAQDGKGGFLHRIVLGLKPGDPMVDHIDGNGLNCRRENLRMADERSNGRNVSGAWPKSLSGVLGVSFQPKSGKYAARIKLNGRDTHLGTFATLEDANKARLEAEKKHWGVQPRRAWAFTEMEEQKK